MSKFERDVDKEAFWRLAVQEQRASVLSVRAFCAREGLTGSNFYAWRRQLAKRDDQASVTQRSPRFVEVTPSPESPPDVTPALNPQVSAGSVADGLPPLELALPRGVVVRVPDHFDAAMLRCLVEALS
jgi:hypothetical protein